MQRFFFDACTEIQRVQPVEWTGLITHTARWLVSDLLSDVIPNPKFKVREESKTEGLPPIPEVRVGFVHGTADRKSGFYQLADRLSKDLPEEVKCLQMFSFSGRYQGNSIKFFANQLVDHVTKTGCKNWVLVGHSRGVKVIEAARKELLKRGVTLHGIVSVAGPYGGSWLAIKPITFFSNSVAEMQPGSSFSKNIGDEVRECTIPRAYYLPEKDHLISKEGATIPEHQHLLIIVSRHGHLSILSSTRLAALISRDIKVFLGYSVSMSDKPVLGIKTLGPKVEMTTLKVAAKVEETKDPKSIMDHLIRDPGCSPIVKLGSEVSLEMKLHLRLTSYVAQGHGSKSIVPDSDTIPVVPPLKSDSTPKPDSTPVMPPLKSDSTPVVPLNCDSSTGARVGSGAASLVKGNLGSKPLTELEQEEEDFVLVSPRAGLK